MTHVYIVEARGSDYYDDLVFHSAYANEADAELRAATLRAMVEEEDSVFAGEAIYPEVSVSKVKLH